jgi:2-polyprenyl-6-methoxyphenol hydroxylase-like FAD-dependent oxidoreductase
MSHAIVMGGSIAGLCAAAALAKNFDRVTVLERDPEPGCQPHRGVPQGNHTHALLRRGQQIIEALLPGTFEALRAAGARPVDLGSGFRWFQFGGWKAGCETGVDMWLQTRPLLEHHVRESVRRLGNVELRFEAAIEEPVHEGGRVRGVSLRGGELLEADLVVDATGRGSRSPGWLEQWGYGRVKEQHVEVGLGYVSGIFELPAGRRPSDALAVYQYAPSSNRRCGFVFPIEGNRVIMTSVGYHGDHAPTDVAGLRKWARGLMRPDVAEILDQATLVGELRRLTFPTQIRRCYGLMLRLPDNYLVMGDAMCSFDPTFGQGMSVSAIQAEALTQLRPGMSTQRWQRKLARMTWLPFSMTANEAHRWAETTGWAPPLARFQRWYVAQVFKASCTDEIVYRRLMEVMHFLVPPTRLFAPRIMAHLWAVHREAQRPLQLPPGCPEVVDFSLSSPLHQTGF